MKIRIYVFAVDEDATIRGTSTPIIAGGIYEIEAEKPEQVRELLNTRLQGFMSLDSFRDWIKSNEQRMQNRGPLETQS